MLEQLQFDTTDWCPATAGACWLQYSNVSSSLVSSQRNPLCIFSHSCTMQTKVWCVNQKIHFSHSLNQNKSAHVDRCTLSLLSCFSPGKVLVQSKQAINFTGYTAYLLQFYYNFFFLFIPITLIQATGGSSQTSACFDLETRNEC